MKRIAAITGASILASIALVGSAVPAQAASSARMDQLLTALITEEKLAHDTYVTLAGKVGLRPMTQISRSETRHQQLIQDLLDARGISDPTAGDPVGVFDDPATQRLYDSLIAAGSADRAAAAQVGVRIEQMDIADIDRALATKPPADVTAVLNILKQGSERHLAAFTRWA